MKHTMNLNKAPYEKIASGIRTIELRLNDEKRRAIKIGDEIEFINTENAKEILHCRVINLHRFDSFERLYKTLPLLKCGYTSKDIVNANPKDMNEYYSPKEQKKYGVVGIEIELE